jgi:uncharacterized protein YdeI (YjbR/CyaY-like superfamily)
MPDAFQAILDHDDEGAARFVGLNSGKKRTLIQIVSRVKQVDAQIAKGLAILHHLKKHKGKIDFKRLQGDIKTFNGLRKMSN